MIVVVRSDDENLKGISIFSHAALKLNPPECYHLVVPGQQSNASDLQKFRDERYGRAAAKAVGTGTGTLEVTAMATVPTLRRRRRCTTFHVWAQSGLSWRVTSTVSPRHPRNQTAGRKPCAVGLVVLHLGAI